ncbi:MAG: hypothetical protein ACOCWM_00375 [Cyclobacteriaceae bacterium]
MAKKFTQNFSDIFSPTVPAEDARDSIAGERREASPGDLTRTTLIIPLQVHDTIKAIAYWERVDMKDVILRSLQREIDKYSQEDLNKFLAMYHSKNH